MTITRILYRGSLSSCNYACGYCPFAKTSNTRAELELDRRQLERFVKWVAAARRPLGVFFTPWGEAIVHRYYRQAMIRLSHLEHVQRVAIQTNLSGHLLDLREAATGRLAIWATYHPGETTVARFLERCETLRSLAIPFSVGVVGLKEHFAEIEQLREQLADDVYLWVNAYKQVEPYYSADEVSFLSSIDPYFRWNNHRWPSRGRSCQTGHTSFTVDGDGDVRRCHFVDTVIGNLYRETIWAKLQPATCPNATCGCHIGYIYRDEFNLHRLYGDNLLERIPSSWPEIDSTMTLPHEAEKAKWQI